MWLSQINNRGPRRAVGTKAAVKASTLLPAESQHHHQFWIKVHLHLFRFCSLRWIWLTKFWSPNQPSWSDNNRATTSIKAPVLSWLMTQLRAGLYVGDALYSPLLFLHMWIEMQSEGKRKRGGTYAQGRKKGKKTMFHWERNLQDQWHKCEFWTMLMFFLNVLLKLTSR